MSQANPLLSIPFAIPFDQIRAEHVEPAIAQLIAEARERIEAIAAWEGPRTYENTMYALDHATEPLDVAFGVVRHLESVATYPEFREAHNAVMGPASEFYSSIRLHGGLWAAVKAYAETEEAKGLSGVRARHLEKTMVAFRLSGADLDEAGKARSAEIDVELTQLTTKFSENVLDSTNSFELLISEETRLAGLPPSAVAAARQSAEQKGLAGWRFTLQAPSYMAVLTYMDDRGVREKLYRAYATRAVAAPNDNREILPRILALRKEKARLLGFAHFADLALVDRMAKTGAAAEAFLTDLQAKTEAFFAKENEQLREFAGGMALEPWDMGYYAEKLRVALYDFDEEQLRPYFSLSGAMAGMFTLTERLFGIRVAERKGVPAWDGEARFFDIFDAAGGEHLASFYSDMYPRENKRGGAWMDAFLTGAPGAPHLGLICGNLTPPIGDQPALLTHRDVETLFHEFGHLLHHALTRVPVRDLAGTSVPWDFVELPSQIMENWCWEREALDLFAKHHETGEPIPEELFAKMKRARTFRAANAQMRQLSFAFVDLALHMRYDEATDGDVIAWSRALLQPFSAATLPADHAMIASFTHLFANPVGYAAGYYSYKWAEVLDADAFSRFRKEGVFNAETGRAFRECILAKGDSEDPAELYRQFMGRDPDPNALLVRSGLASVS
ncbi:MAG: M3 family metallopeptidase [Bryobacterales bacterium]|nr:M3 family metallopeptidase [Bryobacterales bacterium]